MPPPGPPRVLNGYNIRSYVVNQEVTLWLRSGV